MEMNPYLAKLLAMTKACTGFDGLRGEADLTRTEFRLLQEVLSERETGRKIISSELARRLGVTRSAVSQIVTKLERKNIVKRTASPTDKKIAYIELSENAAVLFEQQCARANEYMERAVAEFGEERMRHLFGECEALAAICAGIKAESGH